MVEDIISAELKAAIKPEDVHFAQDINYQEAYNFETGILINFERLTNKKLQPFESHQSKKS